MGQVLFFPPLHDEVIIVMKWSGLAKRSKLFEDPQEFDGSMSSGGCQF